MSTDPEWIRVGQWGAVMHIRPELRAPTEETSGEPDDGRAVQLAMCPAFWEVFVSCVDRVEPLQGRGVDPGALLTLTEPIAKALHKALTIALEGKTP